MLRLFGPDCTPAPVEADNLDAIPENATWIDLLTPSQAEDELAERAIGLSIPRRDELLEIEPSSRLYERNGAAFMTMSVLYGISEGHPQSDPIGFILTDRHLVTVRYVDPKPFILFAENVYAEPDAADNPRNMLVRLLDAIIDRLADEFEIAGSEIETVSRLIFSHHAHRSPGTAKSRRSPELRLEALLMRIGKAQQLLAKLRETSVSATRLLTFLQSIGAIASDEANSRHVNSLIADAQALNDHSNFLGDNLTFLLDATLGLISLQQNNVMKIFSVFAVVFMPPTLIAGVYGMNFEHMPELDSPIGYPVALAIILASAIIPLFFARRQGWL